MSKGMHMPCLKGSNFLNNSRVVVKERRGSWAKDFLGENPCSGGWDLGGDFGENFHFFLISQILP